MPDLKMSREDKIVFLTEYYGPDCFICKRSFEEVIDELTLDHHWPKAWCIIQGWTEDEMNDVTNLRISHKRCNAYKSDTLPLDDETVPKHVLDLIFAERSPTKAERPEICELCNNGRLLQPGDRCTVCSSEAMPRNSPATFKKKPSECSHAGYDSCYSCWLGMVPRVPAFVDVFDGDHLFPHINNVIAEGD